ncbi:hypothetical protein [Actinophytocola oryzae]|uniref:Ca2+-binding RTX toxin-like protein n=1 Tax=Actinophytocola oryzae TaxID=502181 RepID=A0A4R7UVL2_9PSEU|nr:hypothetical protein [Actinophytocola oryzae]TDV40067.1 Ca2+-binding RTX toxin-like protein [Actinophytocola oryzae]
MAMPEPTDPVGFWESVKDKSWDQLWPPDDEQDAWDLAAEWRGVARILESTATSLETQANVSETVWLDTAGAQFAYILRQLPDAFRLIAENMNVLADGVHDYGNQIREARINILVELAVNIVLFAALSAIPGGGFLAQGLARAVAGRITSMLAGMVGRTLAGALARGIPMLARLGVEVGKEAIDETVVDLATQLTSIAMGTRDGLDLHQTLRAAVTGAVGGVLGEGVGKLAEPLTEATQRGLGAVLPTPIARNLAAGIGSAGNNALTSPAAGYIVDNYDDLDALTDLRGYADAVNQYGLSSGLVGAPRSMVIDAVQQRNPGGEALVESWADRFAGNTPPVADPGPLPGVDTPGGTPAGGGDGSSSTPPGGTPAGPGGSSDSGVGQGGTGGDSQVGGTGGTGGETGGTQAGDTGGQAGGTGGDTQAGTGGDTGGTQAGATGGDTQTGSTAGDAGGTQTGGTGGDAGGTQTGGTAGDAGGSQAGGTGGDAGGTQSGGDAGGSQAGGDTGGAQTGGDTGGNQAGGNTQTGGDTGGGQAGGDTSGSQAGGDAGSGQTGGDTGGTQTGGDTGASQTGGDTGGTSGTQSGGDVGGTQTGGDTGTTHTGGTQSGGTDAGGAHTGGDVNASGDQASGDTGGSQQSGTQSGGHGDTTQSGTTDTTTVRSDPGTQTVSQSAMGGQPTGTTGATPVGSGPVHTTTTQATASPAQATGNASAQTSGNAPTHTTSSGQSGQAGGSTANNQPANATPSKPATTTPQGNATPANAAAPAVTQRSGDTAPATTGESTKDSKDEAPRSVITSSGAVVATQAAAATAATPADDSAPKPAAPKPTRTRVGRPPTPSESNDDSAPPGGTPPGTPPSERSPQPDETPMAPLQSRPHSIGRFTEDRLTRDESGRITAIDGVPVQEKLRSLAETRVEQYWNSQRFEDETRFEGNNPPSRPAAPFETRPRQQPDVPLNHEMEQGEHVKRNLTGNLVALAIDTVTGEVFEAVNGPQRVATHPKLQERLDALRKPNGYAKFDHSGRPIEDEYHDLPYEADPLSHAEVHAVNLGLHARDDAAFDDFVTDVQFLRGEGVKAAWYCPNCAGLMPDVPTNAGKRVYHPDGYHDEPGHFADDPQAPLRRPTEPPPLLRGGPPSPTPDSGPSNGSTPSAPPGGPPAGNKPGPASGQGSSNAPGSGSNPDAANPGPGSNSAPAGPGTAPTTPGSSPTPGSAPASHTQPGPAQLPPTTQNAPATPPVSPSQPGAPQNQPITATQPATPASAGPAAPAGPTNTQSHPAQPTQPRPVPRAQPVPPAQPPASNQPPPANTPVQQNQPPAQPSPSPSTQPRPAPPRPIRRVQPAQHVQPPTQPTTATSAQPTPTNPPTQPTPTGPAQPTPAAQQPTPAKQSTQHVQPPPQAVPPSPSQPATPNPSTQPRPAPPRPLRRTQPTPPAQPSTPPNHAAQQVQPPTQPTAPTPPHTPPTNPATPPRPAPPRPIPRTRPAPPNNQSNQPGPGPANQQRPVNTPAPPVQPSTPPNQPTQHVQPSTQPTQSTPTTPNPANTTNASTQPNSPNGPTQPVQPPTQPTQSQPTLPNQATPTGPPPTSNQATQPVQPSTQPTQPGPPVTSPGPANQSTSPVRPAPQPTPKNQPQPTNTPTQPTQPVQPPAPNANNQSQPTRPVQSPPAPGPQNQPTPAPGPRSRVQSVKAVPHSKFGVKPTAAFNHLLVKLRAQRAMLTAGRDAGVRVTDLGWNRFEVAPRVGPSFRARVFASTLNSDDVAEVEIVGNNEVEMRISAQLEPDQVERAVANALAQARALVAGTQTTTNVLDANSHPGSHTEPSVADHGRQAEVNNLDRARQETSRLRLVRRHRIAREMRALVEHLGVHPDDDVSPQRRAVTEVGDVVDRHVKPGDRRPAWAKPPDGYPKWKAFLLLHLPAEVLPGIAAGSMIATFGGAPIVGAGVAAAAVAGSVSGTIIKRWYGRLDKKNVDSGHGIAAKIRAYEAAKRRAELLNPLLARVRAANVPSLAPVEPAPDSTYPAKYQSYPVRVVARGGPAVIGAAAATALTLAGLPFWNAVAHWGVAAFATLVGPVVERYLRNSLVQREWALLDQVGREKDQVAADFDTMFVAQLSALLDRIDNIAGTNPTGTAPTASPVNPADINETRTHRYAANNSAGQGGDIARAASDAGSKLLPGLNGPAAPKTPSNPANPANPVNPANPANPVNPGHPVNPAQPGNPAHPQLPGGGHQQTNSNQSAQATQATINAAIDSVLTGGVRAVLGTIINAFIDRRFITNEYGEIIAQVHHDFGNKMAEQVALEQRVLNQMMADLTAQVDAVEAAAGRVNATLASRVAHMRAATPPAPTPATNRPRGHQRWQAFMKLHAMQAVTMEGLMVGAALLFNQGTTGIVVIGAVASTVAASFGLRYLFRRSEQVAVDETIFADRAKERPVEQLEAEARRAFLVDFWTREITAAANGQTTPNNPPPAPRVPPVLNPSDTTFPDHIDALIAHERELMFHEPRPWSLTGPRLVGLDRLARLTQRVRVFTAHWNRTGDARPMRQAQYDLNRLWQAYQEMKQTGTPMPTDHELLAARKPEGLRGGQDATQPAGDLQSYLDDSVATPAGRAFYASSDQKLLDMANQVPVEPGQYTIDMHGGPDFVRIGDDRLSAADLAALIRADPNWQGEDIRLLACETGQLENGFAQQLADLLGVTVHAPSDYVGLTANGLFVSTATMNQAGTLIPVVPPNGRMIAYHPRVTEQAAPDDTSSHGTPPSPYPHWSAIRQGQWWPDGEDVRFGPVQEPAPVEDLGELTLMRTGPSLYTGAERLWPDELADLVTASGDWAGGPARLQVRDGHVDAHFVQRLADLLGVPVHVRGDTVAGDFPTLSSGTLEVYNEPPGTQPGDWRTYEPRNVSAGKGN